MTALFRNAPVLQNDNPVRHTDGREPVRDKERHLALRQFGKALEYLVFRAGIERGGRLVEDQQLRVSKVGAGELNLWARSAGRVRAGFGWPIEQLLIVFRQLADDSVGEALLSGEMDIVH